MKFPLGSLLKTERSKIRKPSLLVQVLGVPLGYTLTGERKTKNEDRLHKDQRNGSEYRKAGGDVTMWEVIGFVIMLALLMFIRP